LNPAENKAQGFRGATHDGDELSLLDPDRDIVKGGYSARPAAERLGQILDAGDIVLVSTHRSMQPHYEPDLNETSTKGVILERGRP
jgi:hypothetical protein